MNRLKYYKNLTTPGFVSFAVATVSQLQMNYWEARRRKNK